MWFAEYWMPKSAMAASGSWSSGSGNRALRNLKSAGDTTTAHLQREEFPAPPTNCICGELLERHFPGFTVAKLTNAMDLKRSFGPIYTRGLMRQGRTAFAVLGVNQEETQSSIDAALTFAILWLDACRNSEDRVLVEGIKLFLPAGTSSLTRERLAHLHAGAAKWQLYEFDERHDTVTGMDFADRGNVATRLVRAPMKPRCSSVSPIRSTGS